MRHSYSIQPARELAARQQDLTDPEVGVRIVPPYRQHAQEQLKRLIEVSAVGVHLCEVHHVIGMAGLGEQHGLSYGQRLVQPARHTIGVAERAAQAEIGRLSRHGRLQQLGAQLQVALRGRDRTAQAQGRRIVGVGPEQIAADAVRLAESVVARGGLRLFQPSRAVLGDFGGRVGHASNSGDAMRAFRSRSRNARCGRLARLPVLLHSLSR